MSLLYPNGNFSNIKLLSDVANLLATGVNFDAWVVKRGNIAAPLPLVGTDFETMSGVPAANFNDDEVAVIYVRTIAAGHYGSQAVLGMINSIGVDWYNFRLDQPLLIGKDEWNSLNYRPYQYYSDIYIQYFTIRLTKLAI